MSWKMPLPRLLKSDLTYSLSAGFALGLVALHFMQPAQAEAGHNSQRQLAAVSQQPAVVKDKS